MPHIRFRIFTVALIPILILACVIPGMPTPASLPAPTADTILLSTMVAETVSAALEQTAVASAPTPTPELTSTPTPASPASGSGSLLTKRDNGTTYFGDQKVGYEVIIPAGWLALRVNEQEYFDAWKLPEAADPAIQRSLTSIQSQNPNQFRLFALDTQEGQLQNGFVTNINFLWTEDDTMSLTDADLNAASEALKQGIPGLEVQDMQVTATSSGLPIGVLTSTWQAVTADGANVVIFQKQVFIKPYKGTLVITLSTLEDLKETILPVFDEMIETVSILN